MATRLKIRELAKKHKTKFQTIANHLDVTAQTVSYWNTGETFPKWRTIGRLCEFFNCTYSDLIEDGGEAHE